MDDHTFKLLQVALYPFAWIAIVLCGYLLGSVVYTKNIKNKRMKIMSLVVAFIACWCVIWIDKLGPMISRLL